MKKNNKTLETLLEECRERTRRLTALIEIRESLEYTLKCYCTENEETGEINVPDKETEEWLYYRYKAYESIIEYIDNELSK